MSWIQLISAAPMGCTALRRGASNRAIALAVLVAVIVGNRAAGGSRCLKERILVAGKTL